MLKNFQVGWKLREKIESGRVKLDIGGHFRSISLNDDFIKSHLSIKLKATPSQLKELDKAIETEVPLNNFIQFENSHFLDCNECGKLVVLETNGVEIRCANPCIYPQGLPSYEIELNVPSGKFVVANDLRDYFPIIGDYNVNKTICCKQTSEKYAQAGMAYMNVGNTCPGMFRINDGSFVIGTVSSRNQNPVKGSHRVAGICTDLWWYSIVDYDQFLIRAKREPGNYEQIVTCKPGVYRFKHQYHLVRDNNYTRADIYSFIDWIRDPDPVRDFQGEWMALNFTAGQIIQDKLTGQYSDLYTTTLGKPVSKLKSIMKAADTLMCANGGGIDYHPNGWLGSNPDLTMDAPDLKIPRFQGKHRWYPMSDWSLLAKTAGIGKDYNGKGPIFVYMNPSFIELAFNICQNIIRFGSESMYTDKKHDHCKSNIMLAKKCFKALVKRFPTQVPSYCKGLIE